MNLQRYLYPAIVAAAMHAAFVALFPGSAPNPANRPPVEVAKPPPPKPTDDLVVVEERSEIADNSVKPNQESESPPPPDPFPDPQRITISPPEVGPPKIRPGPPQAPSGPAGPDGIWQPGVPRDSIVPAGHLDHPPRAISQIAPSFPREMQSAGIGGTVTIEFTVDSAGRVISATILSSTRRDFDDAAVRAVMHWRFEPGRRNGRVVPFRMAIPINFNVGTA